MTPKQRKFCDEYLITGNATDAAIKAGYSTWDQVQVARIAVTNRLFEMGADPNTDLVIFVNAGN